MLKKTYKLLVLFALIAIFGIIIGPIVNYYSTATEITVFGMGKADSILINNKDYNILIDAGHRNDKKY